MTIHLPALSGIILTYLLVFSRVGAMVMLLPAIGKWACPAGCAWCWRWRSPSR
jgi:flagellar biosynthesis protein FliR